MQAIEFSSVVTNGVIPIPEQYIGNEVKVIVFPEHSTEQSEGSPLDDTRQDQGKKKGDFHCIGIDMTGFQFDREAANER
jgi:hypothetical protein